MEDRLITVLTDLQTYCPDVKKISVEGLIFILQDIYYLDYKDWEEWRNGDNYLNWLKNNLTK